MYYLSFIKPCQIPIYLCGARWYSLHIFNISVNVVIPFTLSYTLTILCPFTRTSFLFTPFFHLHFVEYFRMYNKHFPLFDTTRFSGGIWVLPGEFPVSCFINGREIHTGSLWWVVLSWMGAVEGSTPNLTFFSWPLGSIWHVAHSIFPEPFSFDIHDVVDKSGVCWSGRLWTLKTCRCRFESWLYTPVLRLD